LLISFWTRLWIEMYSFVWNSLLFTILSQTKPIG
jgi:hypothetical protein